MKLSILALLSVTSAVSAAAVPEAAPVSSDVHVVDESTLDARMPCYGNGYSWGRNRAHALDRAERWCSGNGGSGSYAPDAQKRGCYPAQYGSNIIYIFRIWNRSSQTNSLTSEECEYIVQQHILNCNNGGWGNPLDQWESTADVNEGTC